MTADRSPHLFLCTSVVFYRRMLCRIHLNHNVWTCSWGRRDPCFLWHHWCPRTHKHVQCMAADRCADAPNQNVSTYTLLTLQYAAHHWGYTAVFFYQPLPRITDVWLNETTADERQAAAAAHRTAVHHPRETWWLSDAVMRGTALGPCRRMTGHRGQYHPCHDEDPPSITTTTTLPGSCAVQIRWLLPPPRHWSRHVSVPGTIHPLPLPQTDWLPPCSARLSVCLLSLWPCVLFPHRREGRGPPSLETACQWAGRTPLIDAPSQSAAAHLQPKAAGLRQVWSGKHAAGLGWIMTLRPQSRTNWG